MFNFSPNRARASLRGRLEIISREIAYQWPHLVNDAGATSPAYRDHLAAHMKTLLHDIETMKRALYYPPPTEDEDTHEMPVMTGENWP